jgi:flagellar biogenesis protein FliO
MRPTSTVVPRSAYWLYLGNWPVWCLLACLVSQPSRGQDAARNYPTAILSSGGAATLPGSTNTSPERSPAGSPWTADTNPVGSQLRPHSSQGYSGGPGGATPSVTTASAFQDSGLGSLPNAVLHAVPATASSAMPAGREDTAKHIPLAPPSQRFKGEAPKPASSTLQTLFSVGSSLLVVLGLFLGVAWCYRRTLSSTLSGALPKQVVQVMGRSSISPRQQLVVVRFGSKLVLVSLIQGEARTLSEIADPLEVDQLVGLCESGQPGSITNSFKSVLLQEGKR